MPARWLTILAAVSVWAQTAPAPATVSGTVMNSLTGDPVLRAHATVQCSTKGSQKGEQAYGALTNEKGEFTIGPIPPGDCNAHAERVGFEGSRYEGNIALASGTHKTGVKLLVTPYGSITGSAVNSAGEPMEGVGVNAQMANGGAAASTDEKGEFRIGGLRPGRYRIKATPQLILFVPEIRTDGTTEQHYAGTYFPESLNAKGAQRIDVKGGAEVSGIDIKLVETPFVRVSGQVTGIPAGARGVMMWAQPPGYPAPVSADGAFAIWRLDPGKYILRAQQGEGSSRLLSAPLEIEVTTANIDHLELRVIPPFDIAGRLRFDDEQAREAPGGGQGGPNPPRPQPRRVYLSPMVSMRAQGGECVVEADDSFKLVGIQPGRYRMNVTGNSYVKSLRTGDAEDDGDILDVTNGAPQPVTITLSSDFGEISGTISDSKSPAPETTVVLFRADGLPYLSVRSGSGSYRLRAAPGKYKLVAVEDGSSVWGLQGADLDDMQPEAVEIGAGGHVVLVRQQ